MDFIFYSGNFGYSCFDHELKTLCIVPIEIVQDYLYIIVYSNHRVTKVTINYLTIICIDNVNICIIVNYPLTIDHEPSPTEKTSFVP